MALSTNLRRRALTSSSFRGRRLRPQDLTDPGTAAHCEEIDYRQIATLFFFDALFPVLNRLHYPLSRFPIIQGVREDFHSRPVHFHLQRMVLIRLG